MCGRNAKLPFFLLALALAARAPAASAKAQNFASGTPLGFGVVGGVQGNPSSDFPSVSAGQPRNFNSSFSHFLGFEPYLDLVNVAVRGHLGWHFYPTASGSGADTSGAYSGDSAGGSFDYGVRFLLSPYQNESLTQRAYFVLGIGQSIVKLKNSRTYSTGAQAGHSYSERVEGTGTEVSGGVGYEFFLVQNYSFQLEGGYQSLTVGSFHYTTDTDVTGATASGAPKNSAGHTAGFHSYRPYGQVAFNLNF